MYSLLSFGLSKMNEMKTDRSEQMCRLKLFAQHQLYLSHFIFLIISVSNPCEAFTNVNCSDICLVVDGAPVCSCSIGFKLGANSQTCIGKSLLILLKTNILVYWVS